MNRAERRRQKSTSTIPVQDVKTLENLLDQARSSNDNGNTELALSYLNKALAIDPHNALANNNIGSHYMSIGDYKKAEHHIKISLTTVPSGVAYFNLGIIYHQRNKRQTSFDYFQHALKLSPNSPLIHNALGNVFLSVGKMHEAILCFERALSYEPDFMPALHGKAISLIQLARYDSAIVLLEKIIGSDVNRKSAYILLSIALYKKGYYKESRAIIKLATDIFPREAIFLYTLQGAPIILDSFQDIKEWYDDLTASLDDYLNNPIMLPHQDPKETIEANFYMPYLGGNPRPMLEKIAQVFRQTYPSLSYVAPHANQSFPLTRHKKLRVGFVSHKLYEHAVTWVFRELVLETARQNDMEVYLYHIHHYDSHATAYDHPNIKMRPMYWEPSKDGHITEANKFIAKDALDILVFMDIGMDQITYFLAFARLAPVQILLAGHPVTPGITTIDYFMSSHDLESTISDDYYTEKLIRFDAYVASYQRPPTFTGEDTPCRSDYPELPAEGILYFCIQSSFKINPVMDKAFKEILDAVPNSYLILVEAPTPSCTDRLARRLKKNLGDCYDRVIWKKRMSVPEFLRYLTMADIMLDTFPFHGGNTTFQSYSYGKPIVSLRGDYIISRVTYAISNQMSGRPAEPLMTTNLKDYIDAAIRLGQDAEWCRDISDKILAAADDLFLRQEPLDEWTRFLKAAAQGPEAVQPWIGPRATTEEPPEWTKIWKDLW